MLHMFQSVLADLSKGELALVGERIAEAEDEPMIEAELIVEWVGSWFTDGELPPPEAPRSGG
jgi:hypothetical protein